MRLLNTLAAIADKPDQSIAAAASGLFNRTKAYPSLLLERMPYLPYNILLQPHDSKKAAMQYKKCLKAVKNKDNLTQAIDKQYPFFCKLSTFTSDSSEQFANAQPTLLKEVLAGRKNTRRPFKSSAIIPECRCIFFIIHDNESLRY